MPPSLLRFGWLFLALGFLINIVVFRARLLAAARRGDLARADAERFVRALSAAFLGLALAQGAVGLASGQADPFCPLMLPPSSSAFSGAAWTVQLLWPLLLIGWLWRGDGAELIVRVLPFLGASDRPSRPLSARQVRLVCTAFLLVTNVAGFLLLPRSTHPSDLADAGCATAASAPHAR